ncbi:hypothetical protein HPB49_022405 [Dermacentor silvarum]|uniref:Uncharacterized protein n=1 Tax=Dermacentor silvarum TaxID=543639 RepID=A0ACB8CHU6_DERSI|nr:hypothetical protein HPB49_022405 [Dermacentor silvarum]
MLRSVVACQHGLTGTPRDSYFRSRYCDPFYKNIGYYDPNQQQPYEHHYAYGWYDPYNYPQQEEAPIIPDKGKKGRREDTDMVEDEGAARPSGGSGGGGGGGGGKSNVSLAAIAQLFPPDKSCDIVIYTHVRVYKAAVIGSLNDISYQAFRNACATYRDTTCGLSFDVRYLEPNMFQTVEVRDDLSASKNQHRVHHYGILNILEHLAVVEKLATVTAPDILRAMRNLLGFDRKRHKVFVGVGYYFYNETNAWADLEYTAENLALPEVDIVVVLSTIVTMPSSSQCITLPVNAYRSRSSYSPTLASDKAYRMTTSQFSTPELIVALALQMGVVSYTLENRPSSPNSGLYQPCEYFGISDYSQASPALPASAYTLPRVPISR